MRQLLGSLCAALIVAVGVVGVLTPSVSADNFVDRVNALQRDIARAKRSDLILLPPLADLEPPPAGVFAGAGVDDRVRQAALLPATASQWPQVEQWLMAESQRAVLEALREATADEDPRNPMAFAQPYGALAVAESPGGLELIAAGLYSELGDPPALAGVQHLYLPTLDNLVILANAEATRLAAEGQMREAMELLIRVVYLGRQMSDRAFLVEVDWGIRTMIAAVHRIRDIAYTDFRADRRRLTPSELTRLIERLDDSRGFLQIERIRFPRGNRIAAEQLIAMTFERRGGPAPHFGQVLGRLTAGPMPLRLFSDVARWGQLAATHRDWFDTTDNAAKVHDDWVHRWTLSPFDPLLRRPTYFDDLEPSRDAVLFVAYNALGNDLISQRMALRTELAGTRTSLAVLAFVYTHGGMPRTLAVVAPTLIPELPDDPYNETGRARGGKPPLQFFVPIRDQRFGEREDPRPHNVNVVVLDGRNFTIPLDDSHFVLYSVGPNHERGWARTVREDVREFFVGDYLVWPPVISLYRQHLADRGALR